MGNSLKQLKQQLPSLAPKPLIIPPIFSVEPENENLRVFRNENLRVFRFADLKKATKKFRQDRVVECEDGSVRKFYKGYIDETTFAPSRNGTGVAVSVMECDSSRSLQDWMAVVRSLGQMSHQNLVNFLGYCSEDNKPLFLVFEYSHRGSLDSHIFGKEEEEALPWEIRVKIAIGTAQGLAFLHSIKNSPLHRELRMHNIMLDEQYNAKLFYLESTTRSLVDEGLIAGRFRYLAPEYGTFGLLDMKTDVCVFGMILLELLMGSKDRKKIKNKEGVEFWTTSLLPNDYKIEEIIDPRLGNDYSAKAATQMGTLINQCTAHDTKKRPLMQQVLDGLNYIAEIKD
ncbi:Protein kinase-like domain superfamily [Arabidopsis thaliana x Arabidopsis arenosa]|uniref:Protein kinase-like domain superfamily n=1 Tax=Arabidopsis thaliana x Arabidopsis arenosa TaxID=1240361 RepID=A0A8T1YV27_9BRAS|nr:Protein kinase-like domain superfamily [Arabidopsis thaliana x Arabidopsis arenosa]